MRARPVTKPTARGGYVAVIDDVSDHHISGWAIDYARLPAPAMVAALRHGKPIAITTADRNRPDVALAGFPSAACGFAMDLPAGGGDTEMVNGGNPEPEGTGDSEIVFWPDRICLPPPPGRPHFARPAARNAEPQLGIVCTWHEGCGIATYARHVAGGLSEHMAVTVYAADHPARGGASRALLPCQPALKVHLAWHDSDAWLDLLCDELSVAPPDHLLVEHHPGLLSWHRLARLIDHARSENICVYVRLHTARRSLDDLQTIHAQLRLCRAILIHTEQDANLLNERMPDLRIHIVPHGIDASPELPRTLPVHQAGFHIGTFGFLHAYKGTTELLVALHLLRRHVPALRATLLHALTEDSATAATAIQCATLIERLNLQDVVTLDLRVLPMPEVAARLRSCDVLAFPYQDSAESASGAARALASLGVPMLCTPSSLFADLLPGCHTTQGHDSYAIAAALLALATDRTALQAT